VVLVLVDTLRADHLGLYGYQRDTAPFLNELATSSVVFEHATSSAPATFPAVNSLFTSRLPDSFYHTNARDLGIPAELTTLAEALQASGLSTGAVSASPIVRESASHWNVGGGFGQGFGEFDEPCGTADRKVPAHTAPCVTSAALKMLDRLAPDRFFLYVHFLDPHDPYAPPAETNLFAGPYKGKDFIAEGRTPPISRWLLGEGPNPELVPRDIEHLIDLYDGEIRAVDDQVRQLYDRLVEKNLAQDTLFVLLSDHGESFMEHNHIQHGRSMYQTELHVPLIFHWAGLPGGVRRQDPVSTIDVMPTILTLAGVPVPPGAQGRALFARRVGSRLRDRPCFSAGWPNWKGPVARLRSLRVGSFKLIRDVAENTYELYDLSTDPDERTNLAPADGRSGHPKFSALRGALDAWAPPDDAGETAPGSFAPDVERALRALGYVE
jgi:arylsulfatase A-like enzyme